MLRMASVARDEMVEHCRREFPNEACGYLAGKNGVAAKASPIKNAHASPSSYEMDPVAQMALQKQLRQLKLEEMAIYHSHVATQAYPSRRDIDNATAIQEFFAGHYVLVSLQEPLRPIVKAFKIRDGFVQEEAIEEVAG